jgi:cytochrome oxidase Cu insertion factor (SCO1/SenC/PrrC family)
MIPIRIAFQWGFRMMRFRVFGLLFLGLLLVGCSRQGGQQNKQGSPAKSPPSTATVGLEVGNLAPEIEGEDIDGVKFKLSDYRGKVVLLDFWATW